MLKDSRPELAGYMLYGLIVIAVLFMYKDMAEGLVNSWNTMEEYSHGYFLPVIAVYFLWRKRALFQDAIYFVASWTGVGISFIALYCT